MFCFVSARSRTLMRSWCCIFPFNLYFNHNCWYCWCLSACKSYRKCLRWIFLSVFFWLRAPKRWISRTFFCRFRLQLHNANLSHRLRFPVFISLIRNRISSLDWLNCFWHFYFTGIIHSSGRYMDRDKRNIFSSRLQCRKLAILELISFALNKVKAKKNSLVFFPNAWKNRTVYFSK